MPVTDSVARGLAEERLADRISQRQTNLAGRPDVSIEGLPFLLQAARETYPEVRVRADAKTDRGSPVKADVTFDNVSRAGDGYRADSASARFTAPYSSLGGGADADTLVSDAGNGQLLIRRSVLGAPVVLTAGSNSTTASCRCARRPPRWPAGPWTRTVRSSRRPSPGRPGPCPNCPWACGPRGCPWARTA